MGLARIICSAKVSKLVEEGRHLEKVSKIFFWGNCTFREEMKFDLFPVVGNMIEMNGSNIKLAINNSHRM